MATQLHFGCLNHSYSIVIFLTNLFIIIIILKLIYFIDLFFWLHLVFVAVRGLSLVAASGGYSSLWWLLLLQSTALGMWDSVVAAHRLSSCGLRALEHRLSSCGARA